MTEEITTEAVEIDEEDQILQASIDALEGTAPEPEDDPLEPEPEPDTEIQEVEDTPEVQEQETEVEEEGEVSGNGELEDLQKKLATSEDREKNAQRRMGEATTEAANLRRDIAQRDITLEELKRDIAELKAVKTSEARSENLDTLDVFQEFPELKPELQRQDSAITGQTTKIDDLAKDIADMKVQAKFQQIEDAHRGCDSIIKSAEFVEWEQSHRYRDYVTRTLNAWENGDPQDVIKILDDFKEATAPETSPEPETSQTTNSLAKAKEVATPKTRNKARSPDLDTGTPRFTRQSVLQLSPEEYDKYETEIEALMAAGKLL